ncbi:PLDc N-terminal domain-containing protein [Sphingobacterium sp. JUb78]|uniref:PLDc N-terminal domain-containing protein n=2 Tax=Sphingobacterium TaxID=28453 RepID=UPI0010432010|nr:membrane-anchored protein YejM (alkaline phosphatase superfamily) [Sphingobacterium kitahiroshimense]TCR11102.1 phospholipase D-like protein [Sphingobacterium sp. JUb78]
MTLAFLNLGTSEMLLAIFIVPFIIVLYTVYHILKNKNLSSNKQILWIIVVFLFNFIGSIFYWWFGKDKSQDI